MEFSSIIKCIQQQKQIFLELIVLAEKQFEALKRNDLENLAVITAEQEFGIRALQQAGENMQISKDLDHIQKEQIQILLAELRIKYEELQDLTATNRFLLKNAIRYSKSVVRLLEGSQTSLYGNEGNVKTSYSSSMDAAI